MTPGDTPAEKALTGLRCPECGVKFESVEDLESHVQTDHPEVSPETSAAGKKAEASPAPKVRWKLWSIGECCGLIHAAHPAMVVLQ